MWVKKTKSTKKSLKCETRDTPTLAWQYAAQGGYVHVCFVTHRR